MKNTFENTPVTNESEKERLPIQETETSISYLGVKLEKAKNRESQFVPDPEQYKDFINDKEIALPLQRDIAVSFLSGDPLLIEGGTSLGKTTTVRKMCAELGYEIHYANLNGASDVEDLMGRYIPNPNKRNPEDPEYVFADGKVTMGLRQEEGKKKVIILDEFNSAAPNILIRLHEVLDALERGESVTLSEDASESIKVNKEMTKIVALMNPPGKGYFGREPIDPAQLRRWVYNKLPSKLPKSTFSFSTDALFGLGKNLENANIVDKDYFKNIENALTLDQMKEIPGIEQILEKYKEFHSSANELLVNRKIAADQPQPFTFDDRMEVSRVRNFVSRFYTGDISGTFQQALRYYYVNKLENATDRKKLEEIIRTIEWKDESTSKRKAFEEEEEEKTNVGKKNAKNSTNPEVHDVELDSVREKIGKENFFGPEEIEAAFGFSLSKSEIPLCPYTFIELQEAKERNEMLILRVETDDDGKDLSMEHINELAKGRVSGKLLYDIDWYKDESFFKKEKPRVGWALVSKECIDSSLDKDYIEQTRALRDSLEKIGALSDEELEECSDEKLDEIKKFMNKDYDKNWKKAAEQLAELAINKNHRRTPVEALYDFILRFKSTEERSLENTYDWTNTRTSDGSLVFVGNADSKGAYVYGGGPRSSLVYLGVVSVR